MKPLSIVLRAAESATLHPSRIRQDAPDDDRFLTGAALRKLGAFSRVLFRRPIPGAESQWRPPASRTYNPSSFAPRGCDSVREALS